MVVIRPALALASWGAFAAISSGARSLVRKALQEFVGPGHDLVVQLRQPVQRHSVAAGEVVFASLANAAVWLLVCWLAKIKRFLTRSRPS